MEWSIALAQLVASEAGSALAPWANITAAAACICMLGWLVTKRLPEMDKERREERTEIINAFREERALDREQIEKLSESTAGIVKETNQLIGQCVSALERQRAKGTDK